MAKKSMKVKQQRAPKFSTRAYTRCRVCGRPHSDTVDVPSSKMKKAIADILVAEGYVKGYEVIEDGIKSTLRISLKYGEDKNVKVITGLKRISKPGLRVFAGKDELPKVLGGLGTAIISTDKGLMTDKAARKAGLGGEVIAFIW